MPHVRCCISNLILRREPACSREYKRINSFTYKYSGLRKITRRECGLSMHHNVNSRVIIFLVHISNNMVRARPLKFFFYQYQVHLSLPLRFLSRIYDVKLYIYIFLCV